MERKITKNQISILSLALTVVFWHLPVYADLAGINQELTIRHTGTGLTIHRDLNLKRGKTDDILRGSDLTRAVKDFIRKAKDRLTSSKIRQSDRIRGAELNRITNDNTKDAIRRNKIAQREQRRSQRDQIQLLKARNRNLKQRIRDMSRR